MMKNMCRVCGRYAANKRSMRIFEDQNILWNIQVLSGLMLEDAECLPDLICICCQTELREAIRFRERLIGAQQELLTGLSEEQLKHISMDYKLALGKSVPESHKSNDTNGSESESEHNAKEATGASEEPDHEAHDAEQNIILEMQSTDDNTVIDKHEEQDDLMEYNIIIDEEFLLKDEQVSSQHATESTENPETEYQYAEDLEDCEEKVDASDYNLLEKKENEECAILDEVLNDEIATAESNVKKRRGRKRLGNLMFVCDECGSHISGRMAFDLHCRRHRGDKQFECDICQDRFCTSSELKRHTRKHTGERPFACQYCGRCFTDYSTRVKHERTHTNERPYVCQSCGKAFTTAYILKNHMLIHSGERAFSCEACNKTFIRQTHLVTHNRSSAHKRHVERLREGLC